jgi:hypothetical protein
MMEESHNQARTRRQFLCAPLPGVSFFVQPGAGARLNGAAPEPAACTAAYAGRIPLGAGLEQTGLRAAAQPRPRWAGQTRSKIAPTLNSKDRSSENAEA